MILKIESILTLLVIYFNSIFNNYLKFLGRMFKNCQKMLKFQEIGKRKYYDLEKSTSFKDLNLEICPGYETSVKQYKNNVLINVDLAFKVLRGETALDFLNQNSGKPRFGII